MPICYAPSNDGNPASLTVSLATREQDRGVPAEERSDMRVEVLPEETSLSPFLQKLSRTAPYLFMGVLIFGALAWRPTTAPIELETLGSAWHMHLRDSLVPLRNGVAAPQIPPLLHWLILAGWEI